MHSQGSPTPSATENQNWRPRPCLLGAQKRAEVLHNPCIVEGSQSIFRVPKQKDRKTEAATSPLPSRGPKRGRKWYATLAFWVVPNAMRKEKIRNGYLTPAFSEPKRGRKCNVTHVFSRVLDQYPRIPNRRRENQKWLPHPCLLRGPNEGGIATQPLHSRRSRTPCARENQNWLPHACLLEGPKEGRIAT